MTNDQTLLVKETVVPKIINYIYSKKFLEKILNTININVSSSLVSIIPGDFHDHSYSYDSVQHVHDLYVYGIRVFAYKMQFLYITISMGFIYDNDTVTIKELNMSIQPNLGLAYNVIRNETIKENISYALDQAYDTFLGLNPDINLTIKDFFPSESFKLEELDNV